MEKKDNLQTSNEKLWHIPMEVTEETIRDFCIDKSQVRWVRIGIKWIRAIMVPVTEEQYRAYMRPLERELKRQQRHKDMSLDQLYEQSSYEFPDGYTDVESEAIKRECVVVVRKILADVKELDRTIMNMVGEGYSEAKIGEAVGMSQRGVGKRKQRNFSVLRDRLKDYR